jgi:hypothetical protein
MRRLLTGILLMLLPSTAWAVCPTTTLTFKDAAGVTQTLCFGGSAGAYVPQHIILDAAGTNALSVSAAGAAKVDGSAVTQPVSGTVTSNAGTGTFTVGGTVTSNQGGTWTVQPGNTANTTAWKIDGSAVTQPVSGTVTANQGGIWTVQPGNTANTTAWKVDGSGVTQPVSGTVTANAGTGTFGVSGTVTSNQGGTWTVQPGNTANTTAWKVDGSAVTQPVSCAGCAGASPDPCVTIAKNFYPVNVSTATTTLAVTGTASKKTYICSVNLVAAAADNVALIEGGGATCTTAPTAGLAGGTSAASGWNFAANGGLTLGGGSGSIMAAATAANNVCLVTSAATQLSGTIVWVQN